MAFIYKATNTHNGKIYVGRTSKPKLRMRVDSHVWYAKNSNCNIPFANALKKYGKKGFLWEILEECSKEDAGSKEIYWIDKLKPQYNVTLGGDGGTYGKCCPDHVKEATRKARSKPVVDNTTGIIYPNAVEASKSTGVMKSSISRSCNNNLTKCRNSRFPRFRFAT
jgi:group I intron endonuclease